jgi:small conductance mechanosensitive channel
MTSFITILGAAGLAIGMAFSGTLSNFAGGVMILVLKPFKVGDVIIAQTAQGTVTEIQIFNTYLLTADNKVVILPNGPVANGTITNFTKEASRIVEWTVILDQNQDVKKVFEILEQIAANEDKKIEATNTFIGITLIAENGIHVTLRISVKTKDYYKVYIENNKKIYDALQLNKIDLKSSNENK